MSNALIIFLSYGAYLVMVGSVLVLSWLGEKLDPDTELKGSLWDELFPSRHR